MLDFRHSSPSMRGILGEWPWWFPHSSDSPPGLEPSPCSGDKRHDGKAEVGGTERRHQNDVSNKHRHLKHDRINEQVHEGQCMKHKKNNCTIYNKHTDPQYENILLKNLLSWQHSFWHLSYSSFKKYPSTSVALISLISVKMTYTYKYISCISRFLILYVFFLMENTYCK